MKYGPVPPEKSPDVTFELTQLFDDVQALIRNAPTSALYTVEDHMSLSQLVIDESFPHADKETLASTAGAFYNARKDVTTTVDTATFRVDDEPRLAYLISFYKGAPFGHIYSVGEDDTQFQPPPNRKEPVAFTDDEAKRIREGLDEIEARSDPQPQDALLHELGRSSLTAHEQGGWTRPIIRVSCIFDPTIRSYIKMSIESAPVYLGEDDARQNTTPEDFYNDKEDESALLASVISMRLWVKDTEPLSIF